LNNGASAKAGKGTSRHGLMHVLMLFATLFWAANIVAGKEAVRGFNPMTVAQLRLAGAALLFAGAFAVWKGRPQVRPAKREWLLLAFAAFNGLTLNQICFVGGLARTSVAHTGLIVALGPIMVLVLACVLRLESLTLPKFLGMLISFAGVAVLATGNSEREAGAHWQGDLIVLAGAASFAYFTIQLKEISSRYDSLTLNALMFPLGALFMVPFALHGVLHVDWDKVDAAAWWGVVFMIVPGTVIAYLIYAYVLTGLAASRAAAFAYIQPAIAAALGAWLLAEKITVRVIIGGALILLGVYLAERERGEEPELQGIADTAN
jgi:drug/metabolite transporter (DMT)-like permease